ncbi:bifunctional diaminohydroxyphosphoribosylaminopyrimidine deaminase/5-amino-6-(5-phosphoribosylamino)uracil reductase RibD [Campylobacter sputorum]|uniref:bifunctional diaminohydroxyphosphoribosylaminopyrimidine deaminase/5-amino-6-(5-phosphoribosylamino)uracil reductase RibD n=1 Tax=Campylobacter sputorum TaxID=206 RepID=UPI00053BDCDC|nr:bifunctional diaminohydroxyphosphoribosylaminopyrimidine deaminase/5-amino-6-(5-phosphoribosylamino)uracil reductase RibD [Campylobacter sputorum]
MNDEFYMDLAINEAWKYQILTYPNPAVGCVICDKFGKILSIQAHKEAGFAHAELNAVISALKCLNKDLNFPSDAKKAYEYAILNHNNLLEGAIAYVTLEPCAHYGKTPPCANLLKELKFKKVVIGSNDYTKEASGGEEILKKANINVIKGILKQRCDELLAPFLAWQNGNFSFFKLAASLNGVIIGGVITSDSSRKMVHALRNKISLLAIGGNTVRIDRPLLDARLTDGKAPDVFIYSKQDNFDENIPLFNVKNRKVIIGKDINFIKNYNVCMIEGGENFLKNLPDFVEYILIFFSMNCIDEINFSLNLKLKPLYFGKIDEERYAWFKRI